MWVEFLLVGVLRRLRDIIMYRERDKKKWFLLKLRFELIIIEIKLVVEGCNNDKVVFFSFFYCK